MTKLRMSVLITALAYATLARAQPEKPAKPFVPEPIQAGGVLRGTVGLGSRATGVGPG